MSSLTKTESLSDPNAGMLWYLSSIMETYYNDQEKLKAIAKPIPYKSYLKSIVLK